MTSFFNDLEMLAHISCEISERDRLLTEKAKSKCSKSDSDQEESKNIVFPKETRSSLVEKHVTRDTSKTRNRPRKYEDQQRTDKSRSMTVSEDSEDHLPQKRRSSLDNFFRRTYTHLTVSTSPLFLNTDESDNTVSKCCINPNSQSSSCLMENRKRKKRAVPESVRSKKAKVASFPRQDRETPKWLFEVMREMEGAEGPIRLIYEKILTASDVKSSESRLLIPFKKLLRNDFLTPAESQAVGNVGVETILVNQWFKEWSLRCKIWVMKKKGSGKRTLNYALNGGWNAVVKGNELKAKDKISLWTFRCRGVLCFALDTK
ncbi:hypothetical protein CARUB_v10016530mg [Capsella rubella]|uniref:TF-B3 domain-containing protein n=1 Tax=Capsella rubella TaxID=81985 RepID=R0GI11_9BRAS|nr:putative B3 domain-containing protein At3g49610 [Capsella rubella]EOA11945.1 hypothetical protein CARUB_v10016530mg [Capsella rubella]